LNADGSFGYAPVPGYSGPDSFTYKASDGNSNSSVATVNLTVGKSPATVTLEDLNQVYDKTARQATAATGPPGLTVNLSYSGSSNAPTNVGSYQVIGVVSDHNYAGAATNTLIVQPRPLGVAANDEIRAYGQTNPLFNGVITGLRAGDDITATYSTVADADSPPGVYAIVPTLIDPDGRLMNYATKLTNGSLAVVDLVPNLVDILELPDATFALEWRVCAGRTYRLQHKDRLADAEWATATDDFTPVSWSVTLTNDAGTNLLGFYRLLDVTGP
jgi:hypothetical protein